MYTKNQMTMSNVHFSKEPPNENKSKKVYINKRLCIEEGKKV